MGYYLKRAFSAFARTLRNHENILVSARNGSPRRAQYAHKSAARRYLDLLFLSFRWGDPLGLYYAQEIDRVGLSVHRDYCSYGRFRMMRDSINGRTFGSRSFDYSCLLQDKLLFERYMKACGILTPVSIALICGDLRVLRLGHLVQNEYQTPHLEDDVLDNIKGFCKPQFGIKGKGTFLLEIHEGSYLINGEKKPLVEVRKLINTPHLLQLRLQQHPDIARLHPHSINTIRIITVRHDNSPKAFFCYLRAGGYGSITDNSNDGKLVVRVMEKTACLDEVGYWRDRDTDRQVSSHPDTGVPLNQIQVPFFEEALQLACKAHDAIPGIHSIGWDIAITPHAPCLIEGNEDWGGKSVMWLMPEFASVVGKVLSMRDPGETNFTGRQ